LRESRKRAWKLKVIEKENPQWVDLYESICGQIWIPATRYLPSQVQASRAQASQE